MAKLVWFTEKSLHRNYAAGRHHGRPHKGLKRLYEDDNAQGVPPDTVSNLRKMFLFLDTMMEGDELRSLVVWKVHTLTGDRKGTWSLSVTRNRRLTFTRR